MSRPIKLRRPPQFTAEIVDDARERLLDLLDDLKTLTTDHADDIEVWGSAVTAAGWEIASLGQWLGLEGEAVLLLGGASYPEIAEHQGTSASAVYARVGRSLTLAPYAHASGADGATTRVSAEGLDQARAEYDQEARAGDPTDVAPAATPVGDSLADRVPEVLRAGARRTTEIVAALPDYRRSSVLSTLSVLARQGVVERVGHGVYALPHPPTD
ncbi:MULTISPECIES: hypothetical protein [unclassified Frigoribacterium]|uniref:hypothetical protein n=1 Tax=unclassified Frigoribacterium TaxID=2627005 RepID=UPI000701FDCC|nr:MULTISPECIES: hypothetical protein [unclassified Frigoribacterium]KQO46856.1 hypothetical protein ASF07_04055 [Frigoribacterium sp. Leaf254]KQT38949.1 hypothetical protein ASG28_04055 [Frigoribacterium sp. Leaf415]